MKTYLRNQRMKQRISALRRQIGETDRERIPLDFARLTRDLADLYAEGEKRVEAVRWYGQSIDAYLYAGFADTAIAMCRKVIQYEPRVIRARATLAMLLLARRDYEAASAEIREYVDITRERGVHVDLTRERLRILAELADDPDVRTLVAHSLIELGATDLGQEVLRDLRRQRTEGKFPALSDAERWRRLTLAAVGGTF